MKIDVYHAENTQAELEKISALVDLLSNVAMDGAKEKSVYQSTFESLNLNLLNVFDLLYQVRADLTKAIDAAYYAGG